MKLRLLGAISVFALALVATYSHAALLGRLPATHGGANYQAVFDTDLDITWLANADFAAGRGNGSISMEVIEANLATEMDNVRKLLEEAIPEVKGDCREIYT